MSPPVAAPMAVAVQVATGKSASKGQRDREGMELLVSCLWYKPPGVARSVERRRARGSAGLGWRRCGFEEGRDKMPQEGGGAGLPELGSNARATPMQKRLPSSTPERMRRAKRALVLDLYLGRRGTWHHSEATWQAIRELRERWGIEARAQLPPLRRTDLYLPESLGSEAGPPQGHVGSPEYTRWLHSPEADRWFERYAEWLRDLESIYDAIVPEEARYSKRFAGSRWDLFLSACALYDSPETELVAFADRFPSLPSNVIPAKLGEHDGEGLPIVWLRDPDRVEEAWMNFYNASIEAIFELFVHPQGISGEEAYRRVRNERPELFDQFRRDQQDNQSRPYIAWRPHTLQQDIESAGIMLRESQAKPGPQQPQPPTRKRDPLVCVQCAVLFDAHNGTDPASPDAREMRFTYERLAEMFDLRGPRAAEGHVIEGRKILRET